MQEKSGYMGLNSTNMTFLPRRMVRLTVLLWIYNLTLVFDVKSQCQSRNGNAVDWWIIYQRQQMPFFHFYVDNSDNSNISVIEPEKHNNVLSESILQIITENTFTEHLVYSTDFINIEKIARDLEFPSYGKWMHGIVASDATWSKGFWILHNNLFFPPTKGGKLVTPDDKLWLYTTAGDTLTDIFYICLSISNKDNMLSVMTSISASRPFIHYGTDSVQDFMNKNPHVPLPPGISFLKCFDDSEDNNNTLKHCLYKFATSAESKIVVHIRPRGMVKGGHGFCYNSKSSLQEFVSLTKTPSANKIPDNSIFAITGSAMSSMRGVTCFGQDIAGFSQVVGVMICTKIPPLWLSLTKTRITSWGCAEIAKTPAPNKIGRTTVDNSVNFKSEKEQAGMKKDECQSCSKTDKDGEDSNWKLTSLLENKYKGEINFGGEENPKDYTDIKHPIVKPSKSKTPEPVVIEVDKSLETTKYLIENEKEILAMFCRKGCQFCRKHEILLPELRQMLKDDDIDILYVNIEKISLPDHLQVSWTPTIRYKPIGGSRSSPWIDFENTDISFETLMEFIRNSRSAPRVEELNSI